FTGAPATAGNGTLFTVTATSDESGSGAVAPTITTPGTVCTVGAVTPLGGGSYQAAVTMVKVTGSCALNAKWATSSDYIAAAATRKTTATKSAANAARTEVKTNAAQGNLGRKFLCAEWKHAGEVGRVFITVVILARTSSGGHTRLFGRDR
ncbi:MAG: hypothetical protein WAU58_19560, partial [Terriglobales bacterium]